MRVRVSVTFPEVPAGHACQEVVLDARHFRIAVSRGLRQILSNPHLKRRRIRSGLIRFVRVDLPNTGSNPGGNGATL